MVIAPVDNMALLAFIFRKNKIQFPPIAARRSIFLIPVQKVGDLVRHLSGPGAIVVTTVKISLHGMAQACYQPACSSFPSRIEAERTAQGQLLHGAYVARFFFTAGLLLERLRLEGPSSLIQGFDMVHGVYASPFSSRSRNAGLFSIIST